VERGLGTSGHNATVTSEPSATDPTPSERDDARSHPRAQTGPLAPSEVERAAHARARGLDAPAIPGGRDPDPDPGLREDRRYGRLLLVFVAVIVSAGFVLGIIATILTGGPR
jgi:hypothetical protein